MIVSYENFQLGRRVWEEFATKQHSRHIATMSAVICLAQLVSDRRPKRVVELGGGLGTLTELLARHPCAPSLLATLEDSPICLPSLRKVVEGRQGWSIARSPTELTGKSADLLIVDGGYMSPPELNVIREGTIIFCEGNRGPEREKIAQHCADNGLSISFVNEFLYLLDAPVPEKCCWIGTAIRNQL